MHPVCAQNKSLISNTVKLYAIEHEKAVILPLKTQLKLFLCYILIFCRNNSQWLSQAWFHRLEIRQEARRIHFKKKVVKDNLIIFFFNASGPCGLLMPIFCLCSSAHKNVFFLTKLGLTMSYEGLIAWAPGF